MKTQTLKRTLTVATGGNAPSYNSGTSTWTLNFTAAHSFYAGDVVSFTDPYSTERVDATVVTTVAGGGADATFANARGITFVLARPGLVFPSTIQTDIFRTNMDTDVFSFSPNTGNIGLIQAVGYDGATASIQLSYSPDGTTWRAQGSASTMTTAIADIDITRPYAYGKVTISAIAGVSAVADKIKIFRTGC